MVSNYRLRLGFSLVGIAFLIFSFGACRQGPPQGYEYAGEWGGQGTGPGEFRWMAGLTVGIDGRVYVADNHPANIGSRVQYFSSTGEFLGQWGSEIIAFREVPYGEGSISYPEKATAYSHDICVGPKGNIYILHDSYQPVHYFTPEGRYLGGWREGFEDWNPELSSIALAPNGDVYVSDCGGSYARVEGMITYFTVSGEYLGAWLFDNSTPTDSSAPWALAVAPTGNVYIVDAFQDLVQYFTPTGSLLGEWGKEGITPGEFDSPSAITVGKDGTVYVADSARIQYFTSDGEYVGEFGSEGMPPDGLGSDITGLGVASDGTVYVADAGNHRVVYFRPVRTGFRFFR